MPEYLLCGRHFRHSAFSPPPHRPACGSIPILETRQSRLRGANDHQVGMQPRFCTQIFGQIIFITQIWLRLSLIHSALIGHSFSARHGARHRGYEMNKIVWSFSCSQSRGEDLIKVIIMRNVFPQNTAWSPQYLWMWPPLGLDVIKLRWDQ